MSVVDFASMTGIAQRSSYFTFQLETMDMVPIGTLEVDMERAPTINNNINRTIKRKCSNFVFPRSQATDVDMLMDHVRISQVLSDQVVDIGVFMFADPSVARSTGGDWTEATLLDQGLMLDQAAESGFALAPGSPIAPAIEMKMMERMIHLINVEPVSTLTGANWVSWPVGTSDLTIINDLCALAGMYSVYFDNSGVGTCKSVPNMALATPDFIYGTGTSVLSESVTESNDLLTAPNRYLVINNGMSDAPISGFWDVPDSAPHSFANRGMRVTKTIDSQAVANNEQAVAMAMAEGQSDSSTYEWAAFSTAINPLHDTFNIVEWDARKFHEQEWSYTLLEGADHRHNLRRIYGA